jgi:sigma-B regulation protein RsbU (phosphoserine phosphatase)
MIRGGPRKNAGREEILVVDDTPANLRLLSQMLSQHGYAVRAVTSGPRAIESVRESPPNLIMLDIKMPDMDGYEVTEALKADDRFSDIPIIFISALDEIEDKVKAFRTGGVDYITKPFQMEEVLARTETHLALRGYQRQLQEANRKFQRELNLAGKMQASFLPKELPSIQGWQLSARLAPARETSGDFFDVFRLPEGRYAILIGDVVDKGSGAALFMVYCWSLIRTYAGEHPHHPERVFECVNRRIKMDTDADQFVTAFYGILDPRSKELIYCSAGQNPGIWLNRHDPDLIRHVPRTGPPLGVIPGQSWRREVLQLAAQDLLVLYTDGITEAQNPDGEFFGEGRLVGAIQASMSPSIGKIEDGILAAVSAFADLAEQFDDIALVSILREEA